MIDFHLLRASFRHAIRGVIVVFRTEQSFRLQVLFALFVVAIAVLLEVSRFELVLVILLCVAVLVLELVNSIFERIVDAFKPRLHPLVRDVKDIMAGTVFLAAVCAAIVGAIVFVPYITRLFADESIGILDERLLPR